MIGRNALIHRKIALYTAKFTRTKNLALEAVHRNSDEPALATPLLREVVRLSLEHEAQINKETPMERLTYSVQEAAELTGLHKITIHRAIADGKLRSRLVGRRRLIDARSLREFVGVAD